MKKTGLIIWALLRLPILAAGLYFFRSEIIFLIDESIGLAKAIDFAVYSASTIGTRLMLFLGCVILLGAGFWLAGKWIASSIWRYLFLLGWAFSAIYISFAVFLLIPNPLINTWVVTLILAVNTLPASWVIRISKNGFLNFVFLAGVGLCEALFPQAYFAWLTGKLKPGSSFPKWSWIFGIILAAVFWIFLLTPYNNQRILTLGEKMHASPAVEKFADGSYNWIEFNAKHGLLYAVGHSKNYLFAYDVNRLDQPPYRSKTKIGKPQSFGFNPDLQELYIYKADTQELLYIDALTLAVTRSIPVTGPATSSGQYLSPGDVWLKWNRGLDAIIIASEADREIGTPFVMLNRSDGEILATIDFPVIPTAYLVFHPQEPRLYFNSFRDTYLVAWDMARHETVAQTDTSAGTDRMEFDPAKNELLVASPLDGAILRYDAKTLELKGEIKTSLGDRTLTLDSKRNLLLVGNFINNRLQVIDMNTYKPIASFYIGPWIRTITLDVERGVAYVSTVQNLFRVQYISNE